MYRQIRKVLPQDRRIFLLIHGADNTSTLNNKVEVPLLMEQTKSLLIKRTQNITRVRLIVGSPINANRYKSIMMSSISGGLSYNFNSHFQIEQLWQTGSRMSNAFYGYTQLAMVTWVSNGFKLYTIKIKNAQLIQLKDKRQKQKVKLYIYHIC